MLSQFLLSKKRVAKRVSPTPILDLIEPLPKPADGIITGRFSLPLLTFVALVVVTQNYSFLIVPLGILPALLLVVGIHEFGHILFGWCVGLGFCGVDVGPLCIRRVRNKWALRLRPRIYLGAAHMRLRHIRRIRRQLAICTLGGPVTSYGFALLAFVVGEHYRPTDSFGWTTFLEFSAFFSLLIAIFSTFPYRTRIGGNDAHLLRELLASKTGALQMIAAHATSFAASVGPIPPAYFERWWRMASADTETAHSSFYMEWNAYRAAREPAVAASHLEDLLRQSSSYDVEIRNFLAAEATFFTARHRPTSNCSSVWLRRTRHLEWLDPLSRIRLDVALAESRQEFAKASIICDSGLSLIRDNLNGPLSIRTESEWVEWKKHIEERLTPTNPEVLQPA
ncbi:MAG TPA: M50 family metallopeptidase [Candidatus Acidoferrum sp.]|nr:M50 family metallopeptidase [Candidatus Acidoferrum sp.]